MPITLISETRTPVFHFIPEEVIYAVFVDGELVHIGEGEDIARTTTYVRNLRNELGLKAGQCTARFFEIDDRIRGLIQMPPGAPGLYRQNLERLLWVAHFWQHGRLSSRDSLRGGKGSDSDRTGGLICSLQSLQNVFDLYSELVGSKPPHRWPVFNKSPESSLSAPPPTGARGRPANRQRYLAFWLTLSDQTIHVTHTPLNDNNTLDFAAGTVQTVCTPQFSPAKPKKVFPPN